MKPYLLALAPEDEVQLVLLQFSMYSYNHKSWSTEDIFAIINATQVKLKEILSTSRLEIKE